MEKKRLCYLNRRLGDLPKYIKGVRNRLEAKTSSRICFLFLLSGGGADGIIILVCLVSFGVPMTPSVVFAEFLRWWQRGCGCGALLRNCTIKDFCFRLFGVLAMDGRRACYEALLFCFRCKSFVNASKYVKIQPGLLCVSILCLCLPLVVHKVCFVHASSIRAGSVRFISRRVCVGFCGPALFCAF